MRGAVRVLPAAVVVADGGKSRGGGEAVGWAGSETTRSLSATAVVVDRGVVADGLGDGR